MRIDRILMAAVFATTVTGICYAASDGNYDPAEMGCTETGNAFNPYPDGDPNSGHDPNAHPDKCQAVRLNVGTDNNEKLVRAGTDHEEPGSGGFAGGHNPHHGTAYA